MVKLAGDPLIGITEAAAAAEAVDPLTDSTLHGGAAGNTGAVVNLQNAVGLPSPYVTPNEVMALTCQ
jgi:hypothetical protein